MDWYRKLERNHNSILDVGKLQTKIVDPCGKCSFTVANDERSKRSDERYRASTRSMWHEFIHTSN